MPDYDRYAGLRKIDPFHFLGIERANASYGQRIESSPEPLVNMIAYRSRGLTWRKGRILNEVVENNICLRRGVVCSDGAADTIPGPRQALAVYHLLAHSRWQGHKPVLVMWNRPVGVMTLLGRMRAGPKCEFGAALPSDL